MDTALVEILGRLIPFVEPSVDEEFCLLARGKKQGAQSRGEREGVES